MKIEKLKQMLEDGTITQAEYDELVSKLVIEDKQDDKKDDGKDDKDDKKDKGGIPDNLQSLIQSAVDRATNKLGNDNKKLREELEKLRREKMTEDEIKNLELTEKAKAIAEKEKELQEKEMRMFAIKAIKDAGLDDGSDTALALVDFLMGESEDDITNRTTAFKSLVDKTVSSQVKQRFKDNGRDPKRGGSDDGKDDDQKQTSIAVALGKKTAENNKAAQSVIDNYIGGNN